MIEILPQLLLNALVTGSIYVLASSGLSITFGLLRILNFAHGALMMSGAYLFYLFACELEFPLPLSALCTALAVTILALASYGMFILPFRRSSLLLPLVSTVALSTMLESMVSMLFGVSVKSLAVNFDLRSFELFGAYVTPIQLVIIGSALMLIPLLAVFIHATPAGRQLRAITENEAAAQSLGIAAPRIIMTAFCASLLLAAYAGVLLGYETNLVPTMGNAYTMKAFAAMVLGGLGNMWGTIAGAFILGFVENAAIGIDLGDWSLPAGYKDAFTFVIILAVLLFRPQGIFARRIRTV